MARVAVIGTGYVGLTTSACLAHLEHDVTGIDIDKAKVTQLNAGEIPILELGLRELVAEGLAARRLSFEHAPAGGWDQVAATLAQAEFVFLCLPTPQGDDGAADLSAVEKVVAEIAPLLHPQAIVVGKSTMPVGSARRIHRLLESAGVTSRDVRVASNPEFLREGSAVHDFLHPDRIVVGCDDRAAGVRVLELYRALQAPAVVTDPASAEMVKYASNAYLATKITFVNAIANLCELVDADVREVTLGMGYDKRIGFEFLHPGPGYGGSCFPKDTAALLYTAQQYDHDLPLLRAVTQTNAAQHERVVEKVRRAVGGSLKGANVAIWGLTFKANTDDLRDSPAMVIAARLIVEGASVRAYDPVSGDRAASMLKGLEVTGDPYAACEAAAVLAVLTEWDEFRWFDFGKVMAAMSSPVIVDARNLLDPTSLRRRGFTYEGIGR